MNTYAYYRPAMNHPEAPVGYHYGNHAYETQHSAVVGYILWIFGFIGCHRFYFGYRFLGILYFFTCGLFLIGWIVDLFLIPSMAQEARRRHVAGPYDHNIAWLLHSFFFLGLLGLHRFYLGKWFTGLIWLVTLGLFGVGYIYDWLTLNEQVDRANLESVGY